MIIQAVMVKEYRIENPRVGGSIPPLGTSFFQAFPGFLSLDICDIRDRTAVFSSTFSGTIRSRCVLGVGGER